MGEVVSSVVGAFGANTAAKQSKKSAKALAVAMNQSTSEIGAAANGYIANLANLSNGYNPYDYKAAFASLEESVIAPMERDYFENILPQIDATYNSIGGALGSGAHKAQVAKTSQSLGNTKASLRGQERIRAQAQNLDEYNRKVSVLTGTLSAKTMAPNARVGAAPVIYNAQQDSISARLAATQAWGQAGGSIADAGLRAGSAYMSGGISEVLRSAVPQQRVQQ